MRLICIGLALGALLAGCAEMPRPGQGSGNTGGGATTGPCPLPAVNLSGTVTEVHAASLLVDARGSIEGPGVLHIRDGETTLYIRDGLTCRPGKVAEVAPGDPFEAVANGPVMESYPPQTTPSMVFVDQPR